MTVLAADANGGFTATGSAGTYDLTFKAQNSWKTSATATAHVTFPTANGPTVTVKDGADKSTVITDYRWIIEEDRTFYVDPHCTTNPLPTDCPKVTPSGAPAAFGTNFHTSYMPLVATGCTGPLSCESGQTQQGAPVVCDQGNGVCRSGDAVDCCKSRPGSPGSEQTVLHLGVAGRCGQSVYRRQRQRSEKLRGGIRYPRQFEHRLRSRHGWRSLRLWASDCYGVHPAYVRTHRPSCPYSCSRMIARSTASTMRAAASTCLRPRKPAWVASRSPCSTTRAAPVMRPASRPTTCSTCR